MVLHRFADYITYCRLLIFSENTLIAIAMTTSKVDPLLDAHGTNSAIQVLNARFNNGGRLVLNWVNEDVVAWLNDIGFADMTQIFKQHAVVGAVLSRFNDKTLKEMGIANVGRRLLLLKEIMKVQALSRAQWRNTVLWASEQYRPGPCNNILPFNFPLCCASFTGIPDMYRVTNSKINITSMRKNINTPCTAFCGYHMHSNNTDLTILKDIDAMGSTGICGEPLGAVIFTDNYFRGDMLYLRSSECQKVTAIITNAKEEAVIQEGVQSMQMFRQ